MEMGEEGGWEAGSATMTSRADRNWKGGEGMIG